MIGYLKTSLKFYERIALLVAAICLIVSGTITDAVGIVLLAGVLTLERLRMKKGAA